MTALSKYKNIIIALVVIVGAFIAYQSFTSNKATAVLTATPTSTVSPVEQDLIALLLQLHSIKLDESIFTNQSFMSLQDFSQEIVPQPVGRTNPFAPLGAAAITAPIPAK